MQRKTDPAQTTTTISAYPADVARLREQYPQYRTDADRLHVLIDEMRSAQKFIDKIHKGNRDPLGFRVPTRIEVIPEGE